MSRLRDPETLCDVVAQFRVILGAEAAAQLIKRSTSVIHRSADPDDDHMLTAEQMLVLDEACAAAGHTPFLAYHQRRMEMIKAEVQDVPSAFIDAEIAMGKLAETLRASISATSAMGKDFTPAEAVMAKQAVAALVSELNDIMKSITSHTVCGNKKRGRA